MLTTSSLSSSFVSIVDRTGDVDIRYGDAPSYGSKPSTCAASPYAHLTIRSEIEETSSSNSEGQESPYAQEVIPHTAFDYEADQRKFPPQNRASGSSTSPQRQHLNQVGAWANTCPGRDEIAPRSAIRSLDTALMANAGPRESLPTIMCPYHTLLFENLSKWSEHSLQDPQPLSRFMECYSSQSAAYYVKLYKGALSESTKCCWAGIHSNLSE